MVRNVQHLESHVLGANHWCVEVEIFEVNGHEPCTFGGDDAVEENLGGKHVSHWCVTITWVCYSVAANPKADETRVIFLGLVVCNNTSVCDVFLAAWRYLVGCDEDYSVGSLYCTKDAMGEVAEFFTISGLPYSAVFWVFNEVIILQELTSVCV